MAFNGEEGSYISLETAAELTAAWRGGDNGDMKGYFYGKEKLQSLLDETGSEGIRIYFGETSTGEKTLVLVAANSSKDDIITGGKILDFGEPCPSQCGKRNDLNS